MKKFKISQRQYDMIKEEITLTADLDANNGDANKAIDKVKDDANKAGLNNKEYKIVIPTNESYYITKKALKENRKKIIKENTSLYSINEFIKHLKK